MIDVIHQINAVQRRVGARTLAAGEARIVVVSQTYDAAVEDVWDACTSAERIPRWFLPVSGDLKLGGRYQLEGNAGGTDRALRPAGELLHHLGVRRPGELGRGPPDRGGAGPGRSSRSSTSRTSATRCGRSSAPARSASAGTP